MTKFLWSFDHRNGVPFSGLAEHNGVKCWFEHSGTRPKTEEELEKTQVDSEDEDENEEEDIKQMLEDLDVKNWDEDGTEDNEETTSITNNEGQQSEDNFFSSVIGNNEVLNNNYLSTLISKLKLQNNGTDELNIYSFYSLAPENLKLIEEDHENYKTEIGRHKEHSPEEYKPISSNSSMSVFTYKIDPNVVKGQFITTLCQTDIEQFYTPNTCDE